MRMKQSSIKKVGVMVDGSGMAERVVRWYGGRSKVGLEKVRKLGGKVVVLSGAYPCSGRR